MYVGPNGTSNSSSIAEMLFLEVFNPDICTILLLASCCKRRGAAVSLRQRDSNSRGRPPLVVVNTMDGNKSSGTRPQSSSPGEHVVAGLRVIYVGFKAVRGQWSKNTGVSYKHVWLLLISDNDEAIRNSGGSDHLPCFLQKPLAARTKSRNPASREVRAPWALGCQGWIMVAPRKNIPSYI